MYMSFTVGMILESLRSSRKAGGWDSEEEGEKCRGWKGMGRTESGLASYYNT